MSDYARRFWGDSKYQDLAIEYERNIETQTPSVVSSRRFCPCLDLMPNGAVCSWGATAVTYRRYEGPSVRNI